MDLVLDAAAVTNARASVQRTAYRIVQEGLTNARKHAPHAPVSVAIRGDGDSLRVEVTNPVALGLTEAEIPGTGAGLAGLTERVVERTGVPVVDGVSAAVTIAESLVRLGLTTSKVRTYAPPRPKRIVNWPPQAG